MFYNVENLFDTHDDSLTRDHAFLPSGDRHWTYGRFLEKLNRTYKVIAGVGEWQPPAVIGLAEVENRFVLEALLRETPLHRFGYEIIHRESPDARGIDVALLFRPKLITVLEQDFIQVNLPNERKTRDILYIKASLPGQDTIHLYVNHWPSRYSGTKVSEASRATAASVLINHAQSILSVNPKAKILITGDFNDSPEDASMLSLTDQLPVENISRYTFEGTHKHQGEWSVLDQWLATRNWLSNKTDWYISDGSGKVFHPEWLLEDDEAHLGYKPLRTYVGFKYRGGFSDHLPVYIDLKSRSTVNSINE